MIARIRTTVLVLVLTFGLLGGATLAPAVARAADTTAPVVSEFDFSPKTVDVSTAAKQITITVRLTDESGAKAPFVIVSSDSTTQTAGFGQMSLVSGTSTNGLYSRTVTIPDTAAPGTWAVRLYPTEDVVGNSDSSFRDHPTRLNVTNGAQDTQPPTVSEFDFSPRSVDISTGEKQITISVRLTDESGAKAPFVIVSSDSTTQTAGFGQMSLVSGTSTNGVYSRTVTIPTTAAPGTWAVRLYPTEDVVGNNDSSFRDHPTRLKVTSGEQAPEAPTNVAATAGNGSATVSWTAAVANGSPITAYTITSSPGGIIKTVAGDQTNGTVASLTNGTSYTFTVTATNAVGTGPSSASSNAVIPAGAPGTPTGVTATGGDSVATVSWTAPLANGSPITSYVITSSPGGITKTVAGDQTSGTVVSLTNGTSYTFTVTATNAVGTSSASTPSNAVTPSPAVQPESRPDTPSGFTATVKGSKVVLAWATPKAGTPSVTDYRLTHNKGLDKTLGAGATKYVARGLQRGKYAFTLVARNASGTSDPVTIKVRVS